MEEVLLILFWAVVFSVATGLLAKRNGRNWKIAAIVGFLIGLFGLIFYWILGESEQKKTERIARVVKGG
jgi:hypothetical protein